MIFEDKGGYIFMEHNSANIKKTDFKDVQISSWDDLDKPPFWWSFAPKTFPIGKFFLTVYRRCENAMLYPKKALNVEQLKVSSMIS